MRRRKRPMMPRNRRSLRRRSTGSTSVRADLDHRVHPTQVVALEVAEQDVPPRQETQEELTRFAHVEVRDLTDIPEQWGLLIDGEAVGAQGKEIRSQVRSDHH